MTGHARAAVEKCVALVLNALAATGNEHAIIRSGRVPLLTRGNRPYRMSDSRLPRAAVAEIAEYLLPKDELRALIEIGETRCHLPHRTDMADDDFVVDVTDRDGELCVDIEHHKRSDVDEIPADVFG
jgi:hypothetical protein